MNKLGSILFLLLAFTIQLHSQGLHTRSNRALKAYNDGKSAYDFINYNEAVTYLVEATERDSGFIEAYLLLAEVYKDLRQYEKSSEAYNRVLQIDSLFFVPAIFSLAEVEFKRGKYETSLKLFENYLQHKNNPKSLVTRSEKYIENSRFAIAAKNDPVDFNPISLGDSINTKNDEYWPAITVDDKYLMFTRQVNTNQTSIGSSLSQEDFFYTENRDGFWSGAKAIGEPLNTLMNEGAQTLAAGGQYMYFTACNRPDTKGGCDIYYSVRGTRGWMKGVNINSPVNTPYWDSQPSLSSDGMTLYFVSNRPGGIGGMDIWRSELRSEGGWTQPTNLGTDINTPGDEMSPFIHFDGKTLYFSSDGRPCMGGFDLFMSKMDSNGMWGVPENLGYPINTQTDEMGLIINSTGKIAYFSSTVNTGNGRDLFYFEVPETLRPNPVSYFEGTVFDRISGKKLKASYELINLSSSEVTMKSFTDDNGYFLLCLPSGYNYGLNVNKENYLFYSENFMMEGDYTATQPFKKRIWRSIMYSLNQIHGNLKVNQYLS
jgi:hypothetical protein